MIMNLFKYLRTDDWLDSKVPFMLSILFLSYLYSNVGDSVLVTYMKIGAYFLYVSMFLAFSYVINDFTDMDIDKAAGKDKVMFRLPKVFIWLSIIVIVLLGCVPMFCIVKTKAAFLFYTVFLYITGAAYSVHQLMRFKERGLIGLMECSVAQRCLPLIPIAFLYPVHRGCFTAVVVLSFINGLRYILIHQAVDYENDLKTGVKTFVSEGHNRYKGEIVVFVVVEVMFFVAIFVRLGFEYVFVFGFIPLYFIFESIIYIVVSRYMNIDWFCTFLAVPLEALYNVLFPVLTALILTINTGAYCGILLFVILLTARCFKGKLAFLSVYLKSKNRKNENL